MRIALDALGCDFGPQEVVAGAIDAVRERGLRLTLVGPEKILAPLLKQSGVSVIEIVNATEFIENDEAPVMAVRRKKQSTLVVGANLVKGGQADALVTAGSTGAFMAAGLFVVGRIAEIERPALAPLIPTRDGKGVVMLDVGANMDAKPEHLMQHGVMGSIYAEKVLGRPNPRVALLNVGTEAGKGNQVIKEAYYLLKNAGVNFVGNIEARAVLHGEVDVIVCDGFTGNVVLKFMEGMASTMFELMKKRFTADTRSKLGALLLRPTLRQFKQSFEYSEYGGAPLLGVNGIFVKCHGSSNRTAIKNGLFQAQRFLEQDVVASIGKAIAALPRNERHGE
ncbi:MAG: glycerol-3-phosphate acyltransferase PlsX [Bacillota bacterium]|nr:MAG: glycerol-3-phosphate acyltransferase PlsX [Bacillota bacterium]